MGGDDCEGAPSFPREPSSGGLSPSVRRQPARFLRSATSSASFNKARAMFPLGADCIMT